MTAENTLLSIQTELYHRLTGRGTERDGLSPSPFLRIEKDKEREMNREQIEIKRLLDDPDAVILDTETTGIAADSKIIELSVIDMKGNVLYSSLLNPLMRLPEIITQITGVTDSDLEGKPSFSAESERIARILRGKTCVAWNAKFDKARLLYEFTLCRKIFDNRFSDAMELYARGMGLKMNRFGNYARKLVYAKKDLGIGDNQEHRSLSDCLDTLAVMKAFVSLDNPNPGMCPFYPKTEA